MIELTREARDEAIASLQRYVEEELGQRIGNIAAGAMLGYILEEIGPSIYNRGVADVQEKLLVRVQEVDIEAHEDEFCYWRKRDGVARSRRGPSRGPAR